MYSLRSPNKAMNYQLTIVKEEKNDHFREEMEAWTKERKTRSQWGNSFNETMRAEPNMYTKENVLIVSLTEEQFKAIKAAVLKEFI